ncbi:MAG: nuclear transport factor 2 family protein [Gemmatimonadales bacterium]
MRTLTPTILLMLVSCSPGDRHDRQQSVENLLNEFFVALGTNDVAKLDSTLAWDFYLFENGTVWNRDSLVNIMPRTKGRSWHVGSLRFQAAGRLVHVTYHNSGEVNLPDTTITRAWLESALIREEKGRYQIEFLHSTRIERDSGDWSCARLSPGETTDVAWLDGDIPRETR